MATELLNEFPGCLTELDLIGAASVTPSTTDYTILGRFTCPAGRAYSVGFGDIRAQNMAVGRLNIHLCDSSGIELDGRVRLDIENPAKRVECTVFEMPVRRLRGTAGYPETWYPFPYVGQGIQEDSSFVLRFMGTAATAVAQAKCVISLDVTEYEHRS